MSSTRMRTMCGLSTPLAKLPSCAAASTSSTATVRVHMLWWLWKVCTKPATNSPAKVRIGIRRRTLHRRFCFFFPQHCRSWGRVVLFWFKYLLQQYFLLLTGVCRYAFGAARKYTWKWERTNLSYRRPLHFYLLITKFICLLCWSFGYCMLHMNS